MKNAMVDADTTTTAEPMSPRPSLRKNAAARLITGAITLVISQASGIIIARALGADGKGLASLLFLATLIAVMAVDLGLTMSAVYFVGRRKHSIQVVVSTYLTVGLIGGAFVALIFIVLRKTLFGGHYPNLVIILAISLPATILYGWLSGVLRGQEKILEVSRVNIAGAVVGIFILSLSVFVLQQKEMSIVWSSAATAVFGLVSVALLLHRQGLRFKFRLDTALLKDCIGYGLKGQIGQILQFINYRFDLLVVNALLGMSAVGIYSVGASVSTLIWQIPNALSYALYSRVSSVDHDKGNVITLEVARRSMIFSLLAALAIAPAAYIIPLLYGDSFRPAIVTLWLLLPGVVALSYYKVLGVHMAGQGHPEFFSYAAGVSAVLTLSLDFLLIPFWGINGAAIASSIAYLLTAVISIRQFVRMTGMKRISRLFVPEPGDLRLFGRRLSGNQHVTKGM